MKKKIYSVLTIGIDNQKGFLVSIETVIQRGLFQFEIIGLANKTISESKQRILSAIDHCLPEKKQYIHKKIVTLLSPAGIKKEGSHFDLPIAISYIISDKEYLQSLFDHVIILGELTLTGTVLPIKNIHTLIEEGIRNGIHHFILPKGNFVEFLHEDIYLWKIQNISEIIEIFKKGRKMLNLKDSLFEKSSHVKETQNKQDTENEDGAKKDISLTYLIDSITDNTFLKRALLISLAGKHNLLIVGQPGSGKSLVAKSARELLPKVETRRLNRFQIENLIESRVYEGRDYTARGLNTVLDNTENLNYSISVPFREPHHTSSYSDIIGNKNIPGEIVLANKGILFLDEMSEINKRVLEGLRQPIEDKYIQINQKDAVETDFILIGSMNPCDCGFYKFKGKNCVCARSQIDKFQRKISSPLFQRFDLIINTMTAERYTYSHPGSDFSGNTIYKNVLRVRKIQEDRTMENEDYRKISSVTQSRSIILALDLQNEKYLGTKERNLLLDITKRHYFSKREIYSLLRVARTIADIEGSAEIREDHMHEALSLKSKNT